jgi:hypothetical protein
LLATGCTPPPKPNQGGQQQAIPEADNTEPIAHVKFDVGGGKGSAKGRLDPEPLPSEVRIGACKKDQPRGVDDRVQMKATPQAGGKLTVTIEDYHYYCSPRPKFAAGKVDGGVVIAEVAPDEGTPLSRCSCPYDVTVEVTDVPTGKQRVMLMGRLGEDGDPVPVANLEVEMPG